MATYENISGTIGWLHDRRVRPGEQFEWDGPVGKWMQKVEAAEVASPSLPEPAPAAAPEVTDEPQAKARKRKGVD